MTTYQLTSNAGPADLTNLVEDAVRDGEVLLTRDGNVVARIVSMVSAAPVEPSMPRKRVIGRLKGLLVVPSDFDDPLDDMRPYMEGPQP